MAEETTKQEEPITKTITIKKREYTYYEIKRLYGILGNQTRLAAIIGCIPQYITHLKDKDPDFAQALEAGKDFADGLVINALFENAVKNKDTNAQKFYLTNKIKDEYAERSKQEITQTNIDQVVKEIASEYTLPEKTPAVTP